MHSMTLSPGVWRRLSSHLCALAIAVSMAVSASSQEFGYSGEIGPANWCNLDANYATCCQGVQQSPINIEVAAARYDATLPALVFQFPGTAGQQTGRVALTVVNTGHTIQANVPKGAGRMEIGTAVYNLQQLHFHTRSEHALNGQHTPLEMHLVQKEATGVTAVAGVFIVPGPENVELQKIWADLPKEENEQVTVNNFDLAKLLPSSTRSYRYGGSLTTPPCSEGILWNVLATPITMSQEQISKFTALFSGKEFPAGNARPLQPIQGRVVKADFKSTP